MNIITKPYGSKLHYIKPDISYNKDWNDYFCPESITELAAVPFLYTRIERAGKAIASKFAERYYTGIGYGIQLVATSLLQSNHPENWHLAHSLDNTVYFSPLQAKEESPKIIQVLQTWTLPGDCTAKIVEEQADAFVQSLFSTDLISLMNNAIEEISLYSSLKTGDFIAFELPFTQPFLMPQQSGTTIQLGEIHFTIIA